LGNENGVKPFIRRKRVKMCMKKALLGMLWLSLCLLICFASYSIAQGTFSLSLSSDVEADPGERVAMYLVISSSDPIAGFDLLAEYDPALLVGTTPEFLTRFQYVAYYNPLPGKLNIAARRHHPDSTFIPSLLAGTDTVAIIWVNVTTQDLLIDIQTPVTLTNDPVTSFADNRLVKDDSSFVEPPELLLNHGSVFIKHPLYGDINNDGYEFTIADAIFFFNYLVGSQKFTSRQRANSDVNRDGLQASMSDFIQLIKVIAEE
jgi:hypothetical protein